MFLKPLGSNNHLLPKFRQPLGYHTSIHQIRSPLGQHHPLVPFSSQFSNWNFESSFDTDRPFNSQTAFKPDSKFSSANPNSSNTQPQPTGITSDASSNRSATSRQVTPTNEFSNPVTASDSLQRQAERSPTLPTISRKPLGHHNPLVSSPDLQTVVQPESLKKPSDQSNFNASEASQIQAKTEPVKQANATPAQHIEQANRITENSNSLQLKQEPSAINHTTSNTDLRDASQPGSEQSISHSPASDALVQTRRSVAPKSLAAKKPAQETSDTNFSDTNLHASSALIQSNQPGESHSPVTSSAASIQTKGDVATAEKPDTKSVFPVADASVKTNRYPTSPSHLQPLERSQIPLQPDSTPIQTKEDHQLQNSIPQTHSEQLRTQRSSSNYTDSVSIQTKEDHQPQNSISQPDAEQLSIQQSAFNSIQAKLADQQEASLSATQLSDPQHQKFQQYTSLSVNKNAAIQASSDSQFSTSSSIYKPSINPDISHSNLSENAGIRLVNDSTNQRSYESNKPASASISALETEHQPKEIQRRDSPSESTYQLSEIASSATLNPLGKIQPLGKSANNGLVPKPIYVHTNVTAEAENSDSRSLQKKEATGSDAVPDVPIAWSNLSELVTGNPSSQNQSNSSHQSTSHQLISRYALPDNNASETAEKESSHSSSQSAITSTSTAESKSISSQSVTGKTDQQLSPIDEQQFEILAQRICRLIRHRLETEQEFEQNWLSGYPLWFSSILVNHQAISHQSSPLPSPHNSTISKQATKQSHCEALINRKLQKLTDEIYILLRWRSAIEQERTS